MIILEHSREVSFERERESENIFAFAACVNESIQSFVFAIVFFRP